MIVQFLRLERVSLKYYDKPRTAPELEIVVQAQRPRGKKQWTVSWREGHFDIDHGEGLAPKEREDVMRQAKEMLKDPALQPQAEQLRQEHRAAILQKEEEKRREWEADKPLRDADQKRRFLEAASYLAKETGVTLETMHGWLDEAIAESVMKS